MPHSPPKALEKAHNPATVKSHTPPIAEHYDFSLVYKNATAPPTPSTQASLSHSAKARCNADRWGFA